MRIRRCYTPQPLTAGQLVSLDRRNLHHLVNVLRVRNGDDCVLFNGDGNDYPGTLTAVSRDHAEVQISECHPNNNEPSCRITLAQAISKGERMDWVMQKATELGVHEILPLVTARTTVQLNGARLQKRLAHWQAIVTGACEQCGRARLPVVHEPLALKNIQLNPDQTGLVLQPGSDRHLLQAAGDAQQLFMVIGPEGGLSDDEIAILNNKGLTAAGLGTRILRTETAAMAALAVLNLSV